MRRKIQDYVPKRLRAWFAEGLTGTALGDSGIVDNERGWSRITGRKRQVDLDSISVETMIRVSRYLYTADPLAQWLVDKPVDMAVGSSELGYEVDIDAKLSGLEDDEERGKVLDSIRGYLDPFWENALFNLRDRADGLFTSYLVDGSLCLQITGHNEVTGAPQLDLIDAQQIPGDEVKPLPDRATIPGTVKIVIGTTDAKAETFTVANVDPITMRYPAFKAATPGGAEKLGEAVEVPAERLCFYFRRSRILNSMRGFSVLLAPADWVDGLNTFLWNSLDRAKLLNCMVYDVKMEGGTEATIKAKSDALAKAPLSQPNTHYVHNEKEEMKTVTADLKSYEATTLARAVKNFILGSKSFPEAWFGEGGETNRATLSEQGDPTYRTLESYQKDARLIFGALLNYAYDQAAERQKDIPKRIDERGRIVVWITPTLPPISPKDATRLGAALTQVETGLKQAVDDALLSEKTSRRVFLGVVSQLSGVEVEPDDEMAQIEAEKGQREEKQAKADAEKSAQLYALARMKQKPGQPAGAGDGEGVPPKGGQPWTRGDSASTGEGGDQAA
jgi:hypothetical protein